MRTAKMVIPGDLDREDRETSFARRPVPPKPYARAAVKPEPAKADGPIAPRPLAVRSFVHRPFAMSALPRARIALPTQVLATSNAEIPRREPLPSAHVSSPPPSREAGSATVPAPPPSMTGAIVIDEKMFEEVLSMTGAIVIDEKMFEEVFRPTGTIDVDESWLEDELIEEQEIAPESFWMRGKA